MVYREAVVTRLEIMVIFARLLVLVAILVDVTLVVDANFADVVVFLATKFEEFARLLTTRQFGC